MSSPTSEKVVSEMKQWSFSDLNHLFSEWAEECSSNNPKTFFQTKFKELFETERALSQTPKTIYPKTVTIYTDGSCLGNPGPGGYGAVILDSSETKVMKSLAEGYYHTTNNRMELMAVIKALEELTEPTDIRLISDSKYVIDAFEKDWVSGWKKRNWKDVKNPDLWKRLLQAKELHNITFQWTKGHAGTQWNERCDELANAAANVPTEEDMERPNLGYVYNHL